jgi:hypothetical protein
MTDTSSGPLGEEFSGQVAVTTIFHDRAEPSHLTLPITSPACAPATPRGATDFGALTVVIQAGGCQRRLPRRHNGPG